MDDDDDDDDDYGDDDDEDGDGYCGGDVGLRVWFRLVRVWATTSFYFFSFYPLFLGWGSIVRLAKVLLILMRPKLLLRTFSRHNKIGRLMQQQRLHSDERIRLHHQQQHQRQQSCRPSPLIWSGLMLMRACGALCRFLRCFLDPTVARRLARLRRRLTLRPGTGMLRLGQSYSIVAFGRTTFRPTS